MHAPPLVCPSLPLAAAPIQALGAPLVLGLVAGLAAYGFRQGLFRATLTGLHALAAVIAALGLTGPVQAWLELADVPRQYALPGAFMGVLVGVAVALELAKGAVVPRDSVRLVPRFDQIGGAVAGGVAGAVVAGGVLLALSVAPLPPAWKLDGSRLSLDSGSWMLGVFSRCLGVDSRAREVILRGEPGTPPAAGQPVTRPAWSEPFVDGNASVTRDDDEAFVDTDSSGAFTAELAAADADGDGTRDVGLLERYRLGYWLPLRVLQAPVVTSSDTAYVTDGSPKDTIVYQASATDVDQGDVLTYTVKAGEQDDAGLVTVDPSTGSVALTSPADRETRRLYAFTIVVTDKAGLTAERPVTVHVTKKLKSERDPSPGVTSPP